MLLVFKNRDITVLYSPSISSKVKNSKENSTLYIGTNGGMVSINSMVDKWKFGVNVVKEVEEAVIVIKANGLQPDELVIGHSKGTIIYWSHNVLMLDNS